MTSIRASTPVPSRQLDPVLFCDSLAVKRHEAGLMSPPPPLEFSLLQKAPAPLSRPLGAWAPVLPPDWLTSCNIVPICLEPF